MVRIEVKKLNEGELILGMEVENETPEDVVMCALHGAVGTARKVMGKGSADPWFANRWASVWKGSCWTRRACGRPRA